MSSPSQKAEIVIHPVRMRIIQCLIHGTRLTAYQLQERLPDVPQATLYRHLKKLADAGVLIIAEELPNRGAVEKVYALPEQGAEISPEEIKKTSAEEHLTYFMHFASHLIGQYGRYVQKSDGDIINDGVSYRQFALNLSDDENIELLLAIRKLVAERVCNEPSEQRSRRVFAIIDFPDT